jgi:hypothetical protein
MGQAKGVGRGLKPVKSQDPPVRDERRAQFGRERS